jgi:hypothetical protein
MEQCKHDESVCTASFSPGTCSTMFSPAHDSLLEDIKWQPCIHAHPKRIQCSVSPPVWNLSPPGVPAFTSSGRRPVPVTSYHGTPIWNQRRQHASCHQSYIPFTHPGCEIHAHSNGRMLEAMHQPVPLHSFAIRSSRQESCDLKIFPRPYCKRSFIQQSQLCRGCNQS